MPNFNTVKDIETAARLGCYMGLSSRYWLRLQTDYDLRVIDTAKIEKEVLPQAS
jgi:plasmid maintenance system antidote protein VapI